MARKKNENGIDKRKQLATRYPKALRVIDQKLAEGDLKAALYVVEQAIGKAAQSLELTGKDGKDLVVNVVLKEK